jgi:hypothetical protein
MEWSLREEGVFEIGEAKDGSLMKKTISIPACGAIHHVVSYFTVLDEPALVRPSESVSMSSFPSATM